MRVPDARSPLESLGSDPPELDARLLHRLVVGLDTPPARPMATEDVEALEDPLARLVLRVGNRPQTLRELLAAIDTHNADSNGVPEQASFLVADGGQIRWSEETQNIDRLFRFVVVRSRRGEAHLLVSASDEFDSTTEFLQVIGWDPVHRHYNYYERVMGAWVWAGNSWHALEPPTRGNGPFDSHVNGSLVMKELELPWANWHSQSSAIDPSAFDPTNPVLREPLFRDRQGAEALERAVVKPGIRRWNESRLERQIRDDGRLARVDQWMRQLLEAWTVNLASMVVPSRTVRDDDTVTLPLTFFCNRRALFDVADLLPAIRPVRVRGEFYRRSLDEFGFTVADGEGFQEDGDTHFGFVVPEPAFEDLDAIELLVERGIVSRRFVGCLSMVDFPNPVFSRLRASLVRHVPETADTRGALDLEAAFVESARRAPDGAAERAFLALWDAGDRWRADAQSALETYFDHLHARASEETGFRDLVRLAESRRREFRRHDLAEFRLTTPTTSIDPRSPSLEMTERAEVRTRLEN